MSRSVLLDRMKKLLAATAAALLLVGALARLLPTSAATGDWPKERFDPGNTVPIIWQRFGPTRRQGM